MATTQNTPTMLSDLIAEAMTEKNLSIRGMAEKVDLTYEHMRRIAKGESVPSTVILRAICKVLDIDFDTAQRFAVASKIREKYGNIPAEIAGKEPELEPIERAWQHLTDAQKQDAVTMIQGWAKRNRAMRP